MSSDFLIQKAKEIQIVIDANAPEIENAFRMVGVTGHDKSIANVPQTNGDMENAVGRVKKGTCCNLTQSGLAHGYWPQAMEHFTHSNN